MAFSSFLDNIRNILTSQSVHVYSHHGQAVMRIDTKSCWVFRKGVSRKSTYKFGFAPYPLLFFRGIPLIDVTVATVVWQKEWNGLYAPKWTCFSSLFCPSLFPCICATTTPTRIIPPVEENFAPGWMFCNRNRDAYHHPQRYIWALISPLPATPLHPI